MRYYLPLERNSEFLRRRDRFHKIMRDGGKVTTMLTMPMMASIDNAIEDLVDVGWEVRCDSSVIFCSN